jgi:quinol monooxygenase YgiN
MAFAFLVEFPGGTQEQFDQVAQKLGSKSAPGLLYHVDGPIEGGWRVVDVWESQEALDTFFQEKLGQALQEAGLAMPQPQVWPAQRIVKP